MELKYQLFPRSQGITDELREVVDCFFGNALYFWQNPASTQRHLVNRILNFLTLRTIGFHKIGNAVPVRLASYMAKAISLCLAKGPDSNVEEALVEYHDSYYLGGNAWI